MGDFLIGDRVAVVTGGAKGIGESCVRALCAEGAKVAILDQDVEAGDALCRELGGLTRFFQGDVSNSADVTAAFESIKRDLGAVSLLVNNAGIARYGSVTETDEDVWDRVMNVNVKSAFLCTRSALPEMQRQGSGAIVNVASVQAFISQNGVAAYVTSKSALLGLTRSIAIDYAPFIRCNAVCPGSVDTPMFRESVGDSEPLLEECRRTHILNRIAKPRR